MNRIHDNCTSLAVSVMLTAVFFSAAPDGLIAAGTGPLGASKALESAFAAARAQNWPVPTTPAASIQTPATTPAPAKTAEDAPIMDEAHYAKLMGVFDRVASVVNINPKTSLLFGLTAPGVSYPTRQITFTRDEVKRSFGVGLADPTVLLLINRTADGYQAFRARKGAHIELLVGIKWIKGSIQPTALMPAEEALASFNSELKAWVDELDRN